jgi:hypothetical protein
MAGLQKGHTVENITDSDKRDAGSAVESKSYAALKRDANRYRRARLLGVAPYGSMVLYNGTVLRFQALDDFIDADIKSRGSRGENPPLMSGMVQQPDGSVTMDWSDAGAPDFEESLKEIEAGLDQISKAEGDYGIGLGMQMIYDTLDKMRTMLSAAPDCPHPSMTEQTNESP